MSPHRRDGDGPWPGVLDSVTEAFREFVEEPAFCDEEGMPLVTACLWRAIDDDCWQTGEIDFPEQRVDPDGADSLFGLLADRSAEAYVSFAEDYYEIAVDPGAVKTILDQQPLTEPLVASLNPEATLADLAADITEIGYPTARPDSFG